MIWESFLEKTGDSDVLQKNISIPLFATIERRSETQADEAKLETEQQQMQIFRLKKHQALETKEANNYAEEAKDSTAKVKLKAEQANAILKKHNKVTKKAKLLEFLFVCLN